jgi:2-polyprenyl-3-methyl-5-hydroxy-6-metoxy-1,4-benzoquinol methylase
MASSLSDGSVVEATGPTINEAYYNRPTDGLADYRKLMAGPLWRTRVLLRLIASPPPRRFADLGCGGGDLIGATRAAYPGIAACGFDFSTAQIAANRQRHPDGEWHVTDLNLVATFPPALRGQFDTIASLEVIEHLENPEALLRNARQLAAERGRLVLSTQSGLMAETERRVGHVRHFATSEISDLLVATGWRPVRVWNSGFPFHDLSKKLANVNPDAAMRMFSEQRYGWSQRLTCALLRLAYRFNSDRRGGQLFAVAEAA